MITPPMPDDGLIIPLADEDRNGHGSDGMTALQRAFAEKYLELLESGEVKIKKRAAMESGYAESDAANAATRNLRNPAVRKFIARELTEAAVKVPIDRSFVLFKALELLTSAEARGQMMPAMRALELISRHQDVRALATGEAPPAGGGAGVNMPFDLSKLSTDEKRTLLDLIARASPGPAD